MSKRQPNHRRVKINRTYSVEEISLLFGIHKNTVRMWLKQGLPVIDDKRPMLIKGEELVVFLVRRRTSQKKKCKSGELYCLRCRVPRPAAEGMADLTHINARVGNLVALCPVCGTIMNRRVSLARIKEIGGNISITVKGDERHIVESTNPSLNCYL